MTACDRRVADGANPSSAEEHWHGEENVPTPSARVLVVP